MRTTTWIFIVATCSAMTACAAHQQPETRHTPEEAQDQRAPEPPAVAETPSLSVMAAACEALQSKGFPVLCSIRTFEGMLVMTTHFEQQNALETFHQALEQNITLPFCAAAGSSGQTARVVEELHGKRFRILVCDTQEWTAWQRSEPSSITAQYTCESVNAARDMPVYCRVDHANGMRTMSIKFLAEADLEHHIRPMIENIAEPFCRERVARGDGGLVRLQRAADNATAIYNCETRQMGPWIPQPAQPAPKPAAPARSTSTQQNVTML